MLILWKARQKDPDAGYARTFLTQMEEVLGTCLDRGVKIVTNAGGLNPRALADRLRELASRLGVAAAGRPSSRATTSSAASRSCSARASTSRTSTPGRRSPSRRQAGHRQRLPRRVGHRRRPRRRAPTSWCAAASPTPRSSSARRRGGTAGRATTGTASPVRWSPGHVIECGPQATGGNYPFLDELAPGYPGFPIAEVAADGSSVITKQPGTGGAVTVGTVTAQLLYEIATRRVTRTPTSSRASTPSRSPRWPATACASARCAVNRRRRR